MHAVDEYKNLTQQMTIADFSFDRKRYLELKARRDLIPLTAIEMQEIAKPYYGNRPRIDLDGIIDFVKKVLKPQA